MAVKHFTVLLVVALAFAACDSGEEDPPPSSFQGLGSTASQSIAHAVSANGEVVVGEILTDEGMRAFRWTASNGTAILGTLSTEGVAAPYSRAYDVSADGRSVVGESSTAAPLQQRAAFRWTADEGMVDLGELPTRPYTNYSAAHGVSADGSVVVGQAQGEHTWEPFRWTASGGMQSLDGFPNPNPDLPGYHPGYAYDVSSDGEVIVGWGVGESMGHDAVRWTADGGAVWLDGFPTGYHSEAHAVSADGTVVVGQAGPGNGRRAFRWTAGEGVAWLSEGPFVSGSANGVSADGSIIVGGHGDSRESETYLGAFVWTAQEGMRSVATLLAEAGVDLAGWTLVRATGVSADGRAIVGIGENPGGQLEAWRAVLP